MSKRWPGVALLIIGLVAVIWIVAGTGEREDPPGESDRLISNGRASRSVGGEDARYVGVAKCAECHAAQHESYLTTAHAVALAEVDLEQEPADGEVEHRKSARRYRVSRRDDQLWHRESHVRSDGSEIELSEHPLRYVVGSGRYARTYLAEMDGFLVESPVTWFGQQQQWGMSPGYDEVEHSAFHRPIVPECLYCHMGTFETTENSLYKFKFGEHAIGCERCHGPGSLHAARHASANRPVEGNDPTIVNPRTLSRELSEAICSDCHLSAAASALARGTEFDDFRPGLPLHDFRHEYRFEADDLQMTVTGHVEQMRLSRCYTETDTLTCITCHDPHHSPEKGNRVELQRAVCLDCHSDGERDTCSLPLPDRMENQLEIDCVSCHMPQVPTDLLHIAFTHHRIGIHDREDTSQRSPPVGSRLEPIDDLSHLKQSALDRSRGLACYDLYSREAPFDERYRVYLDRAESLLEAAYGAGVTDPDVVATLALIACDRGEWARAIERAGRVLSADSPPAQRDHALYAMALANFESQRYPEAAEALRRLTQTRRSAREWFMLGISEQQLGRFEPAIDAFEQAARIDPGVGLTHRLLSLSYERRGDEEEARRHQRLSQLLPENGFPHEVPRE